MSTRSLTTRSLSPLKLMIVSNSCPTTSSRFYLQPKTQRKASRPLKKRTLLTSPRYVLEREASVERWRVYHSGRGSLMSSSSEDPKPVGTGKLVAVFSSQSRLNQDTLSGREDFPLRHQQVVGSNEPFFRFSNQVNAAKSLLDGNKDPNLLSRNTKWSL